MKEPYATCASFQATFEKSMTFNSFSNMQNDFSSKTRFNSNKFASHQIFPINHHN